MRTFSNLTFAFALATASAAACDSNGTGNTNTNTDMSTPDGAEPADMSSPGVPRTIQFTASGEELAGGGYSFPAAAADDPVLVDGWEVRFDELLVTFANISLSESPDKSATDQSQTDAKVAQANGPWAVDLHKGGLVTGKDGIANEAVEITTLTNQNLKGNIQFDTTKRYAFGYDVVPAATGAQNVNMDTQGKSDYQVMVQNKWTVLYVGTATFKGTACTSTVPAYDYTKLPKVVKFRIGLASPTSYVNCQNPENDPAAPIGNDEYQRGIQLKDNATTIAQLTLRTERLFWESFALGSAAHFDQLAALAKKDASNNFVVTEQELKGVNFTAFKDAAASPLPWRSCVATYPLPTGSTTVSFDTQGIPYNPTGNPAQVMRDYLDYATYTQSAQGILNDDGLCFVKRGYVSPP